MRRLSAPTQSEIRWNSLLSRQLPPQLRQWVQPKDQRHLQGCAEIVAAILPSKRACLGEWLASLRHRTCTARAHLERLRYFVQNQQSTAERFYEPMLPFVRQAFAGGSVWLTLDTRMLWDQFCFIEVGFVWGGRSFTLARVVLAHGRALVGLAQAKPRREGTKPVLPPEVEVTLLADRGFEHAELVRWLQQHQWSWAIRVKSNRSVILANGQPRSVEQLRPPPPQAYLYQHVKVFSAGVCHLATAQLSATQASWAVRSERPPSLPTLALYGQRFGGMEPHFKDDKSAAFEVVPSGLRDAQALTC